MNWGKIFGLIGAIILILIFFNNLRIELHYAVLQVSYFESFKNLNVSIINANASDIVVKVTNPLNVPVTICNITGKYLAFYRPVIVPPLSEKNITIGITNYTALFSSISNKNEEIIVKLRIENTTIKAVNII
ncbi:hypothetical protein [Stygiolobus caldivivus]|uniref:Uncharacterized protein n=1 Tax=Stygiolobus caldivivus TaxID=2824673 RepID=A0A8D5UA53_9CREN|nr:hypothetical protein [Stygiolobus caldivivus]BCU71454.1 hypothetical protein KN1_27510 [Stygiolobus caldivivus]